MRQRQVVLVIGVPRSGSTWLTDILSSAADTDLVMEPDNEKTSILASFLKSGSPRFPQLAAQDSAPRELGLLWDCSFNSNWAPVLSRSWLASAVCRLRKASREATIAAKPTEMSAIAETGARHAILRALRSTRMGPYKARRIIKSVHAVLYPEWIAQRCRPQSTVVIMRHPLAVLQSWRRMQMPDALRLTGGPRPAATPGPEDAFGRMAGQLCTMYGSLRDAAARNPDWQVVWHEQLCADPGPRMREVAVNCGIDWDSAMEDRVRQMNQAGQGYKPQREAAQEIGKWKHEVTDAEEAAVYQLFAASGLQDYLDAPRPRV